VANASPPAKSSRPDDALLIALLAGDSGLSRRGLTALWRIRQRQREIMRGSRGAFVKIKPRKAAPFLDLAQVSRDTPLTEDYHRLITLELAREFPERMERGRPGRIKRAGGARSIHEATLRLALKPLYEAVADAFRNHFELPAGGESCPVCGGAPWARCGEHLRCGTCESVWRGQLPGEWRQAPGPQARGAERLEGPEGRRLIELEVGLFAQAFDPSPMVSVLRELDT
jgi:hypothetical protein